MDLAQEVFIKGAFKSCLMKLKGECIETMKKLLSILLAMALVFGSFTSVIAEPKRDTILQNEDQQNISNLTHEISIDPSLKELSDGDLVRIIVELKDKPLIEYATAKGVKLDKLDKATANQAKEKIEKAQKNVKGLIKANKINIKYHNEFKNVANGFSGTTTLAEAKQIEGIAGVKSVAIANEYDRPEPDMVNSKDLVYARETWNELGYNGEGMVVAIIDTGVDPSHRDMVLSNPANVKLQKSEIDGKELQGTWRTDKVPYGYNYMDQNLEIRDLGPDASRHGMHVAGIVGANGDETNGGIKGVAPEVQLLAMKVFGNNPAMPSTFGDVIIKAIDDSVALGADVINMSLGSTASFVNADDLEQEAIRRATENGVVNSLSSGNSSYFASPYLPYAKNPDVGVVGSPGLATESIQVASANNKLFLYENTVKAGELADIIGYSKDNWAERGISGAVELVAIGGTKLGNIADYKDIDVKGKVVLVKRGTLTFIDKTTIAAAQGAIGIICYDNGAGGTFYKDQGGWAIPMVLINNASGIKLEEFVINGPTTINIDTTKEYLDPTTGSMAGSTSWGTTPNLDFKPEITAPGGNILSTDQDNGYQSMSGTSMAAPHVSGGSALILQRVDEEFELTGIARIEMAKNLLMSTAKPITDVGTYNKAYKTGNYVSPRRQGAGMMDLYAAASTPTIIVDKTTKLSKVNLKEIDDVSTFTLLVKNFSNDEKTYRLNGTVGTDLALEGNNRMEAQAIINVDPSTEEETVPMSFNLEDNTIVVPAGGEAQFDVTIDLSEAVDWAYWAPLKDIFPNGNFVEGFVQLEDINDADERLDLSIPYVGFYGNWDQAPVIDD
ncbi:MAG: hypothetical protein K0Q65_2191, partial [Clostridia bacterium]|nr:hypothetical protein [Clostridia bacterium]